MKKEKQTRMNGSLPKNKPTNELSKFQFLRFSHSISISFFLFQSKIKKEIINYLPRIDLFSVFSFKSKSIGSISLVCSFSIDSFVV